MLRTGLWSGDDVGNDFSLDTYLLARKQLKDNISTSIVTATIHVHNMIPRFTPSKNLGTIFQSLNCAFAAKVLIGHYLHAWNIKVIRVSHSQVFICFIAFSAELIVCLSLSMMRSALRVMEGKREEIGGLINRQERISGLKDWKNSKRRWR